MSELILPGSSRQKAVLTRDGSGTSGVHGGDATVFISYSRRDMAFIDRLDASLQVQGVKTLVDRAAVEIGERWFDRLKDLISRAETIVFVLSPDSVASKVCADEVAFGKRMGKRFIPVVARRVDTPSVPEALSELNYVFLDDEATYETQLDRLVRAIRTDLAWMRSHADLGRAAEEWAKAGRPRGLLLGAVRLRAAETWIASRPANAPLPTEDARALVVASRRLDRQWRNGLIGGLAFGLVVALGLAALAYVQRQEAVTQRSVAIQQSELAQRREREAQEQRESAVRAGREAAEQRDAARRNFDLARSTIEQIVLDLARGLRNVDGVRISALRLVLSRVEKAVERLMAAAPDDPSVQLARAIMLDEFGDTYLRVGDLPAALRAYEEALEIIRGLTRRSGSTEPPRNLAISLSKVGDVKLRVGDGTGALKMYEEALVIRRALVHLNPNNAAWQRDLTATLMKVGDVKLLIGDPAGALPLYEEALVILRSLLQRTPENMELQREISLCLNKAGDLKLRAGDVAEALVVYREALTIARSLVRQNPDNTEWQRDLSISLERTGAALVRAGDVAGGLAAYEECLQIRRDLVRRDPDNMQWQADQAISLFLVATMTIDTSRKRALLLEALAIFERLAREKKLPPNQTGWVARIRKALDEL